MVSIEYTLNQNWGIGIHQAANYSYERRTPGTTLCVDSTQAPIAAGAHAGRPATLKTHMFASAFPRVARSTFCCEYIRYILSAEKFEQLDLFAPDVVLIHKSVTSS